MQEKFHRWAGKGEGDYWPQLIEAKCTEKAKKKSDENSDFSAATELLMEID